MSLGNLALIVAAGLAGPLFAASRRAFVPVVVGEIVAGVVLGRSGLDVVHADNATVSFLAEAGFAMLMLTVGMHVPLRDRRLRRALGPGALAAGVAAIAAPLGGLVVAELTGTGHIAVYAVLLASGSAAVVLPMLQERRLDGPEALVVIAQVTVADVAAILAVPLVLQPGRAANAAVGGLLVAGCALIVFFVGRSLRPRPWVNRLRQRSKRRGWALDLRLSLALRGRQSRRRVHRPQRRKPRPPPYLPDGICTQLVAKRQADCVSATRSSLHGQDPGHRLAQGQTHRREPGGPVRVRSRRMVDRLAAAAPVARARASIPSDAQVLGRWLDDGTGPDDWRILSSALP